MKNVFIFCAMAAGLLSLTACQKDNPEGDTYRPQRAAFFASNDESILLSNLVFTDENDKIDGYVSGFGLNEAAPGEISIHCETLDQAQTLFRSWVPEGVGVREQGETLIWDMIDTLGVSQGAAKLVPGGSKGAVAHLELPSGFPLVTSVNFIPQNSLPINAELDYDDALDQYFFGNIVNVYSDDFKDGKTPHGGGVFCVIREYDQDTNTSGILLSMPDKEHKVDGIWNEKDNLEPIMKRGRKISELEGAIGESYRAYRTHIDNVLTKGGYKQVNGDHKFCALAEKSGDYKLYNLATKSSEKYVFKNFFGFTWGPDFYECWAYFFTLEKGKDGKYKVVYK